MSAFHYGLCLKDHEELDYVLIKKQPSQSKSTVPAILTSNDFIRSDEIIRTKWPIY